MERESQTIPVRIYQTPNRIVLAAPLPGLEPDDISVSIADSFVTISGKERGPRQHERDLSVSEWRIGPYFREIDLGQPVNGPLTNATFGNGVLVLAMPKAKEGKNAAPASFRLSPIEATRGAYVGHRGSDLRPAARHGRQHTRERKKKTRRARG